MPQVKTVYVPPCFSQQGSSQRSEPDREQSRGGRRGGKLCKDEGEKSRSILKVKLPTFTSHSLQEKATTENRTPARWTLEPSVNNTKTAVNQGGESQCNISGPNIVVADGDVFFFSQRSNSKTTNEKEKAKISVLRTISKMLEENQLIRQRLAALSK